MKLRITRRISAKKIDEMCQRYNFADLANSKEYHDLIMSFDCADPTEENVLELAMRIVSFSTLVYDKPSGRNKKELRAAVDRAVFKDAVEKAAWYILYEGIYTETNVDNTINAADYEKRWFE